MRVVFGLAVAMTSCGAPNQTTEPDATDGASQGEVCNGIDDDADDLVDEDCPCASFDVVLPYGVNEASLVWAGDGYWTTISDRGSLLIAPLIDGVLGTPIDAGPVASQIGTRLHHLAWNGSVLAVVAATQTAYELRMFGRDGTVIAQHALMNATGPDARVTWAGDRFVVVWHISAPHPLAFAEYAPDGRELTPLTMIGGEHALFSWFDTFAASPTKYAIGVGNGYEGMVLVVDRTSHAFVLHQLEIDPSYSGDEISVVSSAGVLAVTRGGVSGNVQMQVLDDQGKPQPETLLPWMDTMSVVPVSGENGFDLLAQFSLTQTFRMEALHVDRSGTATTALADFFATQAKDGTSSSRLVAASAHKRLAMAVSYGANPPDKLRVIQRCE